MIRVAILDDHPVVRDGTAALLGRQPDLSVAWTAASVREAQASLAWGPVDVLLLDLRLDGESGLRLLDGQGASTVRPAVIVLSAYDYPQYVEAAERLGAQGFVLKTAPIAALAAAIRTVAGGGRAFQVRSGAGADSAAVRLSPRELEVVRLVALGRSNDEIGASLGIGSKTVETHLHRVFERHGLGTRAELVAWAARNGWLEGP